MRFQMAVQASWSWMLGWLQCIAIPYQINYAIELWFTQMVAKTPDFGHIS